MRKKEKKTPVAKPATGKKAKKEKRVKPPKKNKNVSQTIPNGRTLQTRDEFFYGKADYRKAGYEHKGNYRKIVVVDSNRKNELAVVKLTTSKKGIPIEDYQKGKSRYRTFVETKDDKGEAIKIGKKFKENPAKVDLSPQQVNKIKKDVFSNSKEAKKNRKFVRKMKGRKKCET